MCRGTSRASMRTWPALAALPTAAADLSATNRCAIRPTGDRTGPASFTASSIAVKIHVLRHVSAQCIQPRLTTIPIICGLRASATESNRLPNKRPLTRARSRAGALPGLLKVLSSAASRTVGIYYLPASTGGWRRGRVDCRSYLFRHSDSYLYSGAALS